MRNEEVIINLEVADSVEPDVWNGYVKKLDGTFVHTYEYSLFNIEIYKPICLFFTGSNEKGEVVAIAVGRLSKKTITGIDLFKILVIGCLPACNDDEIRSAMLMEIFKYARKQKIMVLNINSFSTPYDIGIIKQLGFTVKKRWEFLLSLDSTEDELWKKISPKKRNKIRKGEKQGLSVKEMNGEEYILMLRNLELETQKRKNENDISYFVADKSYFLSIKKNMIDKDIGKLYLAYDKDDNCVAASFFGVFNNTAYYMLSASNKDGLKLAAPDAILWKVLTDCIAKGYKLFNFGGVSESELFGKPLEKAGLYTFKISYASAPHLCYHSSLVLMPFMYRLYNIIKKFK